MQFANVVMSRAKGITYDNLLIRDPDFVKAVDDEYYETLLADTGFDGRKSRPTPMFTPLKLRSLTLPNRVVVSPMAQYLAVDGAMTDWHLMHYGARAMGGAGLVYLEMTCPTPDARITLGCPGLWNDAQEAALKRLVDFSHTNGGARIALQLATHAGQLPRHGVIRFKRQAFHYGGIRRGNMRCGQSRCCAAKEQAGKGAQVWPMQQITRKRGHSVSKN